MPKEIQETVRNQKIRRGMTKEEVRVSWGSRDGWGESRWETPDDIWLYGRYRKSGQALVFEGDKLGAWFPYIYAPELTSLYDSNEVKADDEYKGKIIVVKGMLEKVEKDFRGTPTVVLRGKEYNQVTCAAPSASQREKIASLPDPTYKRKVTWLKGRVRGKQLWYVMLDDCEVLF